MHQNSVSARTIKRMEQRNTQPLFTYYDLPDGLEDRILYEIGKAHARHIRVQMGLFVGLTVLSVGLFGVAGIYAGNEITRTGFSEYLYLSFSDGRVVIASWQAFLSSLLETIPFFSITLALASLMIVLLMAEQTARRVRM